MATFDLETTYLGLDGAGRVTAMAGGPAFWESIDANPDAGATLVTVSTSDGDWPHWEMHPEGEEVLVALEGEGTMILEHGDGRISEHKMTPGDMLVVPRGAWHRGVGHRGLKVLFITYGPGTTHRPITTPGAP